MESNQHNSKQKKLTVGQVAEAVSKITNQHCTSAMIYNYERLGLLETPERSPGGFRLFSLQDVSRVVKIKQLQDEGLLLAEINERMQFFNKNDFDEISWADQPVDRRSQILDAALNVFPLKGYTGTTLQDIAKEVGISGPAIYQYFNNKEDLFLALSDSFAYHAIFEEMTSKLQIKEGATLEDIRQVFIDLGEAFLYITSSHAELIRMFISEARKFPEIGNIFIQHEIAPVEKRVAEYLDYYVSIGLLKENDSLLSVHAFFGMFFNILLVQDLLLTDDYLNYSKNEMISQLVNIFLDGIKKSTP